MTHVSSCVTWHRTHELSHLVSLFPSNYLVWEGIQDLLEYMVLLTKTEVLGDWSWRPQGKGQNGLWSEWEEQGSRDYPHLSLLHSRSWKKNFFLGIILTKSSCIFGADTTPRVHSLTRKCRLDFSSHFLSQTDHFIQGTTCTTLHGSPGWGLYSAACKVIKNSYQISDLRGMCGCFLRLPWGSGVWNETLKDG